MMHVRSFLSKSVGEKTAAKPGSPQPQRSAKVEGRKVIEHSQPVSKRVRRFSIFLILGVVAVLAVAVWLTTTWISDRYYAAADPAPSQPAASGTQK